MEQPNLLRRIGHLFRDEKSEITSIYFYAVLGGLIQLSLPLGIQSIVGFVLGGAMSTSLVILVALVVTGVALNGVLQMNQMKIIERIQQKIFVRYSFAFTEHLPKLNMQKADSYYLPELVNRFFDIPLLQKSLAKILLDFPLAVTQILLGLLLLAFYHPVFIFFGLLLLLLLILIFYVTGNRGLETSIVKSNYKYGVGAWLEEMARALTAFKLSAAHGLHERKADEAVTGYVKARKSHFSILLLQYKVLIVFKVLITAAMLILGCVLLLEQKINIGQFVAAEIIIILIINSVEKLIVNLDSVYGALTSVEKINKLLDKPTEKNGSFAADETTAMSVKFNDVSFAYHPDRPILSNLSFEIQPGEKVCIAGKDGSGKSTILKLLTGNYPGFSGGVLVNDVPIGNYNLIQFRKQIGIVLNQQQLFAGTLWENIAAGDDSIDRGYVSRLAGLCGLSEFLSGLKAGFDTYLNPTGERLPKNVVSKILLMRALAHKPKLLLLEEPWQGLEERTQAALKELLINEVDATVIVASNETAFQQRCSKTIFLN